MTKQEIELFHLLARAYSDFKCLDELRPSDKIEFSRYILLLQNMVLARHGYRFYNEWVDKQNVAEQRTER